MNHLSKPWLSILGLSVAITLSGCNNLPISTHSEPPIHSTENNKDHSASSNQGSINNPFNKCPPFNPEQTICNAQYDPVCVTVKNQSGVSYRTAGNACSACGTTSAVGYVKGQCV